MMTTMNKLAELNVTIDFALPMNCYNDADFDAMDASVLGDIYSDLYAKREAEFDGIAKMSEEDSDLFWTIENYLNNKDSRALSEYAEHMDEPNFDWDFYIDWYKDVHGVRPRW